MVDASALVAAVIDTESLGSRVRSVLRHRRRVAPFLVDAEVGNALRSMVLRGALDDGVGASARLIAERLIHRRYPHQGTLAARAWQLRHNLGFYDALYVSLAESLRCQLVTADMRIARSPIDQDLIITINPDNQ